MMKNQLAAQTQNGTNRTVKRKSTVVVECVLASLCAHLLNAKWGMPTNRWSLPVLITHETYLQGPNNKRRRREQKKKKIRNQRLKGMREIYYVLFSLILFSFLSFFFFFFFFYEPFPFYILEPAKNEKNWLYNLYYHYYLCVWVTPTYPPQQHRPSALFK